MAKTDQQSARISHGIQCPECSGVRISARDDRQFGGTKGWLCEECGCQWSPPVVPHISVPTTCIEHAYGSPQRLSFQIKVS